MRLTKTLICFTSVFNLLQSINSDWWGWVGDWFIKSTAFWNSPCTEKDVKGWDTEKHQLPFLSRDTPEVCPQGSQKPTLVFQLGITHLLHTSCVEMGLMRFYNLVSMYSLFICSIWVGYISLKVSADVSWGKICEFCVREGVINSWETISFFIFC